jgi:hypothetical protein
MAVFYMKPPTQRPQMAKPQGYSQYTRPNYSARPDHMSKPEVKPGAGGQFIRPPSMPQRPGMNRPFQHNRPGFGPPQHTTPIGPSLQLQAQNMRPPERTTPIGPGMQMQAQPPSGGGFGYSPIGGRFGGGGTDDQGRLASALQRLFGY